MEKALKILGMTLDKIFCAYCGRSATDWDHLRPMVKNKQPSGFIDEIRNLVPSCGPCNASKSGADWDVWMKKSAKPKIPGFEERYERLEKFVSWGNLKKRELADIVDPALWAAHWKNHDAIQESMKEAQAHASKIKQILQQRLTSK